MLKQLRHRFTLLCTIITGAVLLTMAACALTISERQLNERNQISFQSSVNSILYKLQSDRIISDTWLAQSEAGDRLIIHVEDNGQPLNFSGSWAPRTDRATLVRIAQEKASNEFGIDMRHSAVSFPGSSVVFVIRGEQNDRYRASVNMLYAHGGWQGLTILQDMKEEEDILARQRILYLALVTGGILLLAAFGWWFAGRTIRPIEKSQHAHHDFIAAASHELRSPLAVIQASATALLADPGNAPHFATCIGRECARMSHLVDDLLLLAGMDAKAWAMEMRPLDCDTLLIECYDVYAPLAKERGHLLALDLPHEPLPSVTGDTHRLIQVLSILLDNALQHTPPGTHITIRPRVGAHTVHIEVEDNGPGIPQEHKVHLFDRFYRADKARSDKEHFGLGLSIAKEIATLHHGGLSLHDTPGGGITFVLEIKIARKK